MDAVAQIAGASRRFLSGTMLSRATGFLRDILMAAAFGGGPLVAAFFMAFRFVNLPRRLLSEGAMHSAFVPHFEALDRKDPERARAFYRDLTWSLIAVLFVLLVVVEGTLSSFLRRGLFDPDVLKLTKRLMPALAFICLYGLNQAYLNCRGRYFLPSVAPAFFNLVWIGVTCLLWGQPIEEAIPILTATLFGAYGLQWLVTWPATLSKGRGTPRLFSRDVRALLKPLFLGMLGVGAAQINSALDPIFARIADPSGPAYLWYAIRLQQLPLALFGVGLAQALLPVLSRASGDERGTLSRFAMRRAAFIMLPCTAIILLGGGLIVELVYQHGHFTSEAAAMTTRCFWAYGLGLFPQTIVLILAQGFYACKDFRTPALASTLSVLFNIGCNALFIFYLEWGLVSVALATALSSLVQAACLLRSCRG